MESEIVKAVAQGGALALVCWYAMHSIGARLDRLTETMMSMNEKLGRILEREANR